ncbi:MAG: hypothetical protein NC933_01125, partial [Candidatus Omnitrophica bacterium]|nr:hypothetical protein [Candidatus Omnitrophota bacterium]
MYGKLTLFFLLLFNIMFFAFDTVYAEVITLKSGEKVSAIIIEKTENYLKIDYKGAVIIYRASEIDNIDGQPYNS